MSSVNQPAGLAVDRNPVVVVEGDQLAELLRACERARLVRDAFHHAAVAEEDVRVVIDYRQVGPIELGRQMLLGERHADGVGDALAEGPGRRLDAELELTLRVSRNARA